MSYVSKLQFTEEELEVLQLDLAHIDVDTPAIIKQTVDTIFQWVDQQPEKSPFY